MLIRYLQILKTRATPLPMKAAYIITQKICVRYVIIFHKKNNFSITKFNTPNIICHSLDNCGIILNKTYKIAQN